MLKSILAVAIFAATAAPGLAGCGKKPPVNNWNLEAGDQRVSGDYLGKLLPGKTVKYKDGGTEFYGADGSYKFRGGGKTYRSNGFRFYGDGIRCIDYDRDPRYDLYVVKDGKLMLINWVGGRYVARVTK